MDTIQERVNKFLVYIFSGTKKKKKKKRRVKVFLFRSGLTRQWVKPARHAQNGRVYKGEISPAESTRQLV